MSQCQMQIGKNGFTPGVMENIKKLFKVHDALKICLLKSTKHTKEMITEMIETIMSELGPKYTYRTRGFTIVIRKWRKARR